MEELNLINKEISPVFITTPEEEHTTLRSKISGISSSESSTYMDPDVGKIELGPAKYLPAVLRAGYEYDAATYSPLKSNSKAPNARLESPSKVNKLTLD